MTGTTKHTRIIVDFPERWLVSPLAYYREPKMNCDVCGRRIEAGEIIVVDGERNLIACFSNDQERCQTPEVRYNSASSEVEMIDIAKNFRLRGKLMVVAPS